MNTLKVLLLSFLLSLSLSANADTWQVENLVSRGLLVSQDAGALVSVDVFDVEGSASQGNSIVVSQINLEGGVYFFRGFLSISKEDKITVYRNKDEDAYDYICIELKNTTRKQCEVLIDNQ